MGELVGTGRLAERDRRFPGRAVPKEVIVTVTGGFHTQGLQKLLAARGISSLVITPNISQDAQEASAIYTALALEQAKLFASNALQLAIESTQPGNAKLRAVANALLAEAIEGSSLSSIKSEIERYMQDNAVEGSLALNESAGTITLSITGQPKPIIIGGKKGLGNVSFGDRASAYLSSILPHLLGAGKTVSRPRSPFSTSRSILPFPLAGSYPECLNRSTARSQKRSS